MASPVKRNWEHTPDADVWLTWGILIHKGKAQNTDFGALVFEIIKQKVTFVWHYDFRPFF